MSATDATAVLSPDCTDSLPMLRADRAFSKLKYVVYCFVNIMRLGTSTSSHWHSKINFSQPYGGESTDAMTAELPERGLVHSRRGIWPYHSILRHPFVIFIIFPNLTVGHFQPIHSTTVPYFNFGDDKDRSFSI